MTPLILVSASATDTERLRKNGPRRDFVELAAALDADVLYSERRSGHGGLWGKVVGPHVRQAWAAASQAGPGQVIFADGEHNGLPLLLFLTLRGKRSQRVVMLGHYVSKRWKRALLWAGTRLIRQGAMAVHSVAQADAVRRVVADGWRLELTPYQVDTQFWSTDMAGTRAKSRPVFVAAGAESRDYETLAAAAREVEADVVIAGASHWARSETAAQSTPANVTFLRDALGFAELRDLYARARGVVVPLHDVPNQSGITTVLEGMSMGLPTIVSATRGQREATRGPLIRGRGLIAEENLAGRGPHLLVSEASPDAPPNGLYVPPGDVTALARAMRLLIDEPELAARMGAQGRADVVRSFDTCHFVERLREIVGQPGRAGRKT